MSTSDKLISDIVRYQQGLNRYVKEKNDVKILHCILKLSNMPIAVSHLEKTGVGRTVNSLRKLDDEVGDAAKTLVAKWKNMVSKDDEASDDPPTDAKSDYKEKKITENSSHNSDRRKKGYNATKEKYKQYSSNSDDSADDSEEVSDYKDSDVENESVQSEDDTSHHKHKENFSSHDVKHSSRSEENSRLKPHSSKNDRKRKHDKYDSSDDSQDKKKKSAKSNDTKTKHKKDSLSDRDKSSRKKSDSSDKYKSRSDKKDSSKQKKHLDRLKDEKKSKSDKIDREHNKRHEDKKNRHEKDKSKKQEEKLKSGKSNKVVEFDIGSESGTSFAEALGMLEPTTSKTLVKKSKSNSHVRMPDTARMPDYLRTSDKLQCERPPQEKERKKTEIAIPPPPPQVDIDINISSLLPAITPNYRPVTSTLVETQNARNKIMNDDEALSLVMSQKNQRTKVFSGNKCAWGMVPTLFELCTRILQDNIDALEFTGGVPYLILKPVLEKATPGQLFVMEHHNPYLIGDTDELWALHCQKEFRAKIRSRQELESWRDMYMRCLDEREAKLKILTANIKQSQDKSLPVRQTKLAYVDSEVKPPRNIAKKQGSIWRSNLRARLLTSVMLQSTLTVSDDMFWILRRTKLTSAALLNSINNNESRPARKDYNKLSSDDTNKPERFDNEPICGDLVANEPLDTDGESNFTDLELDDGDEFSDDTDYDEALTCNVCDRSFGCPKQLSSHKQKKRHFGCSACDSLFPSLMALEHHKEEFEHWSGDEEDLCTESDDEDDTVITEECERLL